MQNYNNPLESSQQVQYHIHRFRDYFYNSLKSKRTKLFAALVGLTLAVPVTQYTLRRWVSAEGYARPVAQTVVYTLITAGALALTDLIRERKQHDTGWANMQRIEVEAFEDIVQQQSQRNYIPFDNATSPFTSSSSDKRFKTVLNNENLAKGIINKKFLPTLIVGATGSGKTVLLQKVIEEALSQNMRVIIFDGKPTRGNYDKYIATGLVDYHPYEQQTDTDSFIEAVVQTAEHMSSVERNETAYPVVIITDEMNNALSKSEIQYEMEKADGGGSRTPKYHDRLKAYTKLLLSQGRQKNVLNVSTTHEASTEALGMGTGQRNNFQFVVLGSPGRSDNVENCIGSSSGSVKLITNAKMKDFLKQMFEFNINTLDSTYYALTNVGGHWRIVLTED